MANQLSSTILFGSGYSNRINLDRVKGNTPFGYYDNDSEFIKDAQKATAFVAQRLGVGGTGNATTYITELTVYAALEEATTTYGNLVYQYKIRDNYINLEGSNTLPFNQTETADKIVLSEDPSIGSTVYWSNGRTATWDEIGNDLPNSASIAQGEIYVSSASINDFLSPDLTKINNWNFYYYQNPSTSGYENYDFSQTTYPQFNKVAGPTSESIDINNNTVYTITSGNSFIYFFTTYPIQSLFNSGATLNTAYYQDTLKGRGLNGKLINNTLQTQIRIAESYAQEAGVGGYVTEYTGSLHLEPGKQVYDLNAWAAASASLETGDRIEIRQIFYQEPPAIVRYFDPYAGTGTGVQGLLETFGFGSYSPGVNFMLMPVYFDIQKIQAIEFNDQIRKSAFSFDLVNNQLRIFPVPSNEQMLLFKYMKLSEKYLPVTDLRPNVVSDVMNVPYRNPIYSNINQVGRSWIFRYALTICKEIEGQIRATFQGSNFGGLVVNGSELLTDSRQEKQDLMTELKEYLDQTTRRAQLERKQQESEFSRQTMNQIPLLIYAL